MLIQSKSFPSKPREACPKASRKPAREGVQAGERGGGAGGGRHQGLGGRLGTWLQTVRDTVADGSETPCCPDECESHYFRRRKKGKGRIKSKKIKWKSKGGYI